MAMRASFGTKSDVERVVTGQGPTGLLCRPRNGDVNHHRTGTTASALLLLLLLRRTPVSVHCDLPFLLWIVIQRI